MTTPSLKRSNLLALGILCWGTTAMLGEILKFPALKGVGLASGAAPFTKVFCQAESLEDKQKFETFAAEFWLHYRLENGTEMKLRLTPETYQQLQGPYQRRNVYGAAIAYAPALPPDLKQATLHYALVSPGKLRQELSIPENATDLSIEMISLTRGSNLRWISTP